MYHGLSAFNRCANIYDLIKRVSTLGQVSACYADRPLGPIGVFCDIEHAERVDYLAEHDVFSQVNEVGQRVSDRYSVYDTWFKFPEPEENLVELYQEASRRADCVVKRRRKYAEIAATAFPAAIWCDPTFGLRWVKRANVLARRFGLTVMTVKSE